MRYTERLAAIDSDGIEERGDVIGFLEVNAIYLKVDRTT